MSIHKVSRRQFLSIGGKASGGLVLGAAICATPGTANLSTIPTPFPIAPETPPEALALNIFVQIGSDDIVYIVAHRSEMGQGSRTGLPQVVADELGADWEKVKVVQALGDAAYGSQNTDGSRSVRDFYQTMREMGASAKLMLRQAAAKQWDISEKRCVVDNHKVTRKDTGASLSFGQLAETASTLPVPHKRRLTFKTPEDFKYIGKPVDIVDLKKMVTGDTTFGIDVQLPDMLYASIEHCPYLGGTLTKLDADAAKKVPGVVDVIAIEPRPLPAAFHPLPGVAVVATNTWAAFEGRKKLVLEWSESVHQRHNSASYMEEMKASLKTSSPSVVRQRGDAAAGFAKASDTLEATYSVPYLIHAPMEPMAATAVTKPDGVEVWACVQTPQSAQKELMGRFGLPAEKVKVNVTLLGGGFGRKSKPDFAVEAAEISKAMKGRPVRLMWTREDEIQNGYYHAPSALSLKAGLDGNKRVTAWQGRACYPSIASTWNIDNTHPAKWEMEMGFVDTPFDIPNEQIESAPIKAHTRIGWMRSVCNIQQAFAVGSFVDEIAYKTGKSPLDTWLTLIGKDRRISYGKHTIGNYGKSNKDYPFESGRLKNVLKTVVSEAKADAKLPKGEGWGIACHYSFLSHVAVATKVRLEDKALRVLEVHCAIDCGLAVNPDRVRSQMEGSVIFGLSAALQGEITFTQGQVDQSNFHDYPVMRIGQSPDIVVHIVESNDNPRGVGEPGVPPVAPSLTNAIAAAGGERIRDLPVQKYYRV